MVRTPTTPEQVGLAEKAMQSLLGVDEAFAELVNGDLFSFSIALVAMKRGHKVARASWRIPGKYVMLQSGEEMFDPDSGQPVQIKEHLIWKNAEGKFVPWSASQDAVLAEDWFIGESGESPVAGTQPPKAEPIQN